MAVASAFVASTPRVLGSLLAPSRPQRPSQVLGSDGHACTAVLVSTVTAFAAKARRKRAAQRATTVEAESTTGLAPWEIDEETEEERQARYTREADEMKLKWDARRLEEKQSAQRRQAWAQKEQERASLYGPRDPIMEAYEARMYEEARVIEVRRRQREVYERIKAHKEGRPLPPKGTAYVELKPPPKEPTKPEEFDVSGHYKPQEDIEAKKYKAPESYVSPTGPAPPPRHKRGNPRAAWETPQYTQPRPNAPPPRQWPEPGSLPEDTVPPVREKIEKERANRKSRRQRMMEEQERLERGEDIAEEEEEEEEEDID
ncbi:unnamed protein product [Effrenium voratum]|nr:unnamed protein product [Effrenium voratum]